MDAVVRPVLVTGSNDVLRQSGMGQIESAVGIGENPSSLGRRDLKGGVAHPFHCNRRWRRGRDPEEISLDHLQLVAKTKRSARASH